MRYNPLMRAHAGTLVRSVLGKKSLILYHRPAGAEGRRFPAVLFLHGLPGAEKSVDVQRALMARGVASVAPHFHGAWGSAGTYRFTTLTAQARAFLRVARALDFVDPRRMAVYGFSMGGWTALNLAAAEPSLKAVLAVAPVGGPEMIGADTRATVARLAKCLNAPAPGPLFADFRRALARRDPARAAARIKAPLLLIHGDRDETVPAAVSERLMRFAGKNARLIVEKGAEHDFLDRRARVARLASRWLAGRLGR